MIYKEAKIHNKVSNIFLDYSVKFDSLETIYNYIESVRRNNKEVPNKIYLFQYCDIVGAPFSEFNRLFELGIIITESEEITEALIPPNENTGLPEINYYYRYVKVYLDVKNNQTFEDIKARLELENIWKETTDYNLFIDDYEYFAVRK